MTNKAKIFNQHSNASKVIERINGELALFFANAERIFERNASTVAKNTKTGVKSKVASVKSDVSSVKSKVANMKSDVTSVRSDVSSVRSDVSSVKSDVSSVKSDVSSVKSDVASVKFRVAREKFKVAGRKLRSNFESLHISDNNANISNKSDRILTDIKEKFVIFAAGFISNADNYLHYSNNIVYDSDQSYTAVKLIDLATEASCIVNKIFIIPLRKDRAFRNYGRFDEEAAGAFDGVIILYCGVPP